MVHLSALVENQWRNEEVRASNINVGLALSVFGGGIYLFHYFGKSMVPAI